MFTCKIFHRGKSDTESGLNLRLKSTPFVGILGADCIRVVDFTLFFLRGLVPFQQNWDREVHSWIYLCEGVWSKRKTTSHYLFPPPLPPYLIKGDPSVKGMRSLDRSSVCIPFISQTSLVIQHVRYANNICFSLISHSSVDVFITSFIKGLYEIKNKTLLLSSKNSTTSTVHGLHLVLQHIHLIEAEVQYKTQSMDKSGIVPERSCSVFFYFFISYKYLK